jgi:hypothetical protein
MLRKLLNPSPFALYSLATIVALMGLAANALHQRDKARELAGYERAQREYRDSVYKVELAAVRLQRDSAIVARVQAEKRTNQIAGQLAELRRVIPVTPTTPPDSQVAVPARYVQACDLFTQSCASERAAAAKERATLEAELRIERRRIADLQAALNQCRAVKRGLPIKSTIVGAAVGYGACLIQERVRP